MVTETSRVNYWNRERDKTQELKEQRSFPLSHIMVPSGCPGLQGSDPG